jgi:hypothetical protein
VSDRDPVLRLENLTSEVMDNFLLNDDLIQPNNLNSRTQLCLARRSLAAPILDKQQKTPSWVFSPLRSVVLSADPDHLMYWALF